MTDNFDELLLYFDGGSRGNPGIAGYGSVIYTQNGTQKIVETYGFLGEVTNNNAEYNGLLSGLYLAYEINPKAKIKVYADSRLVVEQMSGRWKIKDDTLKTLAQESYKIFPPQQVEYFWIPREENKEADKLANMAMDTQNTNVTWLIKTKENSSQSSLNNLSYTQEKTENNSHIEEIKQESFEKSVTETLKLLILNLENFTDINKIDNAQIRQIFTKYDVEQIDKILTINNTVQNTFDNTPEEEKELSDLTTNFYDQVFEKEINRNLLLILDNSTTNKVLNYHIQSMLAKYNTSGNNINILEITQEGKKNQIVALGIKL